MESKEKKVLVTPELLSEMESLKVFGGITIAEPQGLKIGIIANCPTINMYCPGKDCPPPPPSYAPETCVQG